MNHHVSRDRPTRPLSSYPDAEFPPLPPAGAPGEDAALAGSPPSAATDRPKAALLRFLDPEAGRVRVVLRFPFEFDGREVREVTIRRLTVAEVGTIAESYGDDAAIDLYDFLEAMTDLPAPVLRGMIHDDGVEVLDRGRPLLPRFVRTMLGPETERAAETGSATGGASPSPPPGR